MFKLRSMLLAIAIFAALTSTASASSFSLITNGGFESGLTGWNATLFSASAASVAASGGGCATSWTVGTAGTATACLSVDDPNGLRAAYTSFDGYGDGNSVGLPQYQAISYQLTQVVSVPTATAQGTLSWMDTMQWGIFGLARDLNINILDSSGLLITQAFAQHISGSSSTLQHWTSHSIDISSVLAAYAGQNIQIQFEAVIPQYFTGAAGLGLDEVSLTATDAPEPSTFLLAGMAFFAIGIRRKLR